MSKVHEFDFYLIKLCHFPQLPNRVSNNKPKLYFGVRKCESLECPAIFLKWTGCKCFVGSEKDGGNIEYQLFARIE